MREGEKIGKKRGYRRGKKRTKGLGYIEREIRVHPSKHTSPTILTKQITNRIL